MVEGLTIASRVPQAEVAVSDDVVALVLRVLDPPGAGATSNAWPPSSASIGVRIYLQPGGPDTIAPLDPAHRTGPLQLPTCRRRRHDRVRADRLHPGQRRAEPGDDRARARACWTRSRARRCSTCSAASAISRCRWPGAAAHVVAVEGDAGLVQRARGNAARNGIAQRRVPRGGPVRRRGRPALGAARVMTGCCSIRRGPGRGKSCRWSPAAARRRVVYISCHSGSLARDAGLLVREHGFRLTAAGVMDMFPHTAHVEAMAVFDR